MLKWSPLQHPRPPLPSPFTPLCALYSSCSLSFDSGFSSRHLYTSRLPSAATPFPCTPQACSPPCFLLSSLLLFFFPSFSVLLFLPCCCSFSLIFLLGISSFSSLMHSLFRFSSLSSSLSTLPLLFPFPPTLPQVPATSNAFPLLPGFTLRLCSVLTSAHSPFLSPTSAIVVSHPFFSVTPCSLPLSLPLLHLSYS